MKKKKNETRNRTTVLIIFLIMLFTISFEINNITNKANKVENNNLKLSIPSSPIEIDDLSSNDWAWATGESWFGGGSGVSSDPYVIKDLVIDAGGTDDCITIKNSKAHFIIQNCTLQNSGPGLYTGGIQLNNVTNGKIIANNFSGNYFAGINGDNCNDTIISDNFISYSYYVGIYMLDSFYNEILDNDISNAENSYGILIEDSPNNLIEGNEVRKCLGGIEVDDLYSGPGDANENKVINNIIEDIEGNGIWVQSNNTIISGNIVNNNSKSGILLFGGFFNVISENSVYDNREYGITTDPYMGDSLNGSIINNNLIYKNNLSGLYLAAASDNQILDNMISDNIFYGTVLSPFAFRNLFSENFFLNNTKHAYDFGFNNAWNTPTIGNYWDNYTGTDANNDGIGDTPHDISGPAGSKDYLPIWDDRAPIINILSPLNNSNIGRDAPDFIVEIYDPYLDTMWYTIDGGLNNITFTSNSTINQTRWETLWDSLTNGDDITIIFYANDTFGHVGSNFIILIKHVPTHGIGLNFTTSFILILILSGIAIVGIINKIHSKKKIQW